MPEQRHTTTLDIRVDDREIQQLAQSLDRTFSTQVVDKFTGALEKQVRVFSTLVTHQKALSKELAGLAKALQDVSKEGGGAKETTALQRVGETAAGTALGHIIAKKIEEIPEHISARVGASVRGELTTSAMKAVPYLGEPMAEVVEGARQYYQMQVAYAQQRSGAFGRTGLGRGSMDAATAILGERFGIMPEEVPGLLANIAQQTGLTGGALSQSAGTALQLQRLAGVEQGGAVVGAAGAAGGQVSGQRAVALMKDTLTTAIVSGFQESRFDQYFQSLSTFVEQMRNQGFMMDPESVNALVKGLGEQNAETLRGMSAVGVTQNALRGMQKGMRGRGVAAAILMEATGVLSGQRSFTEAQEALESSPAQFFPKIIEVLQARLGGIQDEGVQKTMFRTLWEQMGFGEMGLTRAGDLLRANTDQIREQFTKGEGGAGEELLKQRAGKFQDVVAPMRFEAGKQWEAIKIGQSPEVQKLVQEIHRIDLHFVETVLPPLAGVIGEVVKFTEDLVHKLPGGASRLGRDIKKRLGEGLYKKPGEGGPIRTSTGQMVPGEEDALTDEEWERFLIDRESMGEEEAKELMYQRGDARRADTKKRLAESLGVAKTTQEAIKGGGPRNLKTVAGHLANAAREQAQASEILMEMDTLEVPSESEL